MAKVFDIIRANSELCKALGLNPSKVSEITIKVEPGKQWDIRVKLLPDVQLVTVVCDIIKTGENHNG